MATDEKSRIGAASGPFRQSYGFEDPDLNPEPLV
jgi:hypothetical protein